MKKKQMIILIAVFIAVIIMAGTYLGIGLHYQTHFFPKTSINGIDVADLTAEEAEAQIAAMVEQYQITLTELDGTQEVIDGKQIDYHFVSQGEVQKLLDSQSIISWLPEFLSGNKAYTMEAGTQYDAKLLKEVMLSLNCFDDSQVTAPADAELVQQEDGSYQVTAEVEGNQLKTDAVYELLQKTADTSQTEVNLTEQNCYEKPAVYQDDAVLNKKAEVLNRYVNMTVTYDLGSGVTQTLDSATINSWLSLDDNNDPVFDYGTAQAYVAQLAADYDTIGTWEPFVTSLGETVYVEARTYGWQINQEEETAQLYQILLTGESTQRTPVYYETAWARGENDLGNTYVEIDYTNQKMWYYKDGSLIVETAVVTGSVANGTESPEGMFCLVGKSENEVLKGEGYETPVEYWMPFFGGVGIHDADSWRGSSYGGTIYQTGGSHGCINTPTANAATIYANIDIGTPIVCYKATVYLGDTSTDGSSGTEEVTVDGSTADGSIVDGSTDSTTGDAGTDDAVDGSTDITIEDGTTSGTDEAWADESTYWQ